MKTKLMMLFLLVSCGLWGAEAVQQARLVIQEEINLNRTNLIESLEKLGEKKLVLNPYQTKWMRTSLQYGFACIKSVEDQLRSDNWYSIQKAIKGDRTNQQTCYLLMEDVDRWSEIVSKNKSGTFICNILLPGDVNNVNEVEKCCEAIKRIYVYGAKVVVNAEEGCKVEEYLKPLSDKDYAIMEKSRITFSDIEWDEKAEKDLERRLQLYLQLPVQKKSSYSTITKFLLAGGISVLIAFLCYLKWHQ